MRPSSLRPRPWVIPLALTAEGTLAGDSVTAATAAAAKFTAELAARRL